MQDLCRHTWPGNVRELQNLMERAVLLSPGLTLRVPLTDISDFVDLSRVSDGSTLEQVERELILRALHESNWVVGGARGAAARLRLNRTGLAYKMKKFGIRVRHSSRSRPAKPRVRRVAQQCRAMARCLRSTPGRPLANSAFLKVG